jgi:carbon monoxide dehydrogenase subunit G
MKKLIAIISVLAAGFVGTAKADITMSAGSNLEMQSIGSSTNLSIGGSLGFAFSQDLGNGVTVTMSGLSFGNDVSVVDNIATTSTASVTTNASQAAFTRNSTDPSNAYNSGGTVTSSAATALSTGTAVDADAFEQISFATANGTLTYGSDVDLEGFGGLGVGDVLSSDLSDKDIGTGASALTYGNVVGNGLTYATSFGGSSLTLGYLMENTGGADKFDTSGTSNSNTMAIKTAVPVGPLTATIAYTSDNTTSATNNTFGVSTSMATGNGTLSVAYVSSDNQTADVTQTSAKFATTLGSASAAVGYSSTDKAGASNTNQITATISQSVGTGASVFAEFVNRDGVASGETSAVLLGSSFAF